MRIAHFKYLLGISVIAAVYFLAARGGLLFDAVNGFATLVWPPTGLSLAVLILFGRKYWPGVFIGAFLANFTVGASPLIALGIATGNTLEAVIGASLLTYFSFEPTMTRVKDAICIIFPAALVSTLFSATIGTTSLWLGGTVATTTYLQTWAAWWTGDALGNLIIAPLLLVGGSALLSNRKMSFDLKKLFEALCLIVVLGFVNSQVFFGITSDYRFGSSFIYLIFIPLIWAALRFGQLASTFAVLFTSVLAIWATASHVGPFYSGILIDSLFRLQFFMSVASVVMMILASAIEENTRNKNKLGKKK